MENVSSNGAFFIHGIVFILQTKEQLHASLSLSLCAIVFDGKSKFDYYSGFIHFWEPTHSFGERWM